MAKLCHHMNTDQSHQKQTYIQYYTHQLSKYCLNIILTNNNLHHIKLCMYIVCEMSHIFGTHSSLNVTPNRYTHRILYTYLA